MYFVRAHTNFYVGNYITKQDREKLLESVSELNKIIERADLIRINEALVARKRGINIEEIDEATFCKLEEIKYEIRQFGYWHQKFSEI